MRDPLTNYEIEARGIADELLGLILDHGHEEFARKSAAQAIQTMTNEDRAAALGVIAKSPSQRRSLETRLAGSDTQKIRDAVFLIVRARYLLLMGVNALKISLAISMLPGSSYREGGRRAADVASRRRLEPDLDMLFRRAI